MVDKWIRNIHDKELKHFSVCDKHQWLRTAFPIGSNHRKQSHTVTLSLEPLSVAALVRTVAAILAAACREAPR